MLKGCLNSICIEKPYVNKRVAHLSQVLEMIFHVMLGGFKAEFTAVEQVEKIDDPFLEKKVYGISLAL